MILSIIVFLQLIGNHSTTGTSWDLRTAKDLAVSFFGGAGISSVILFAALYCAFRFVFHVE